MADGLRAQTDASTVTRNAWLTLGDPGLAELVASSPSVDAVTVDLQHSEIDDSRIPDLVRAIELGGAKPLARLAGVDPNRIGRLLDLGVQGLILANVTSDQMALDFVASTRHPPFGPRSFGPVRSKHGDDHAMLWAMIESREGLEAAPSIAAVSGIDGLFVGPGDLGLSIGIGVGQNRREPEFLEALAVIQRAAKESDGKLGIHSTDVEYSLQMIEEGFDLVTVWVDVVAIHSSLRLVGDKLRYS